MTALVLPKYHFHFDDFLKAIRHNKPGVTIPITRKQTSGPLQFLMHLTTKESSRTFNGASIPHDIELTEPAHDDSIKFIQVLDPDDGFNTSFDVSQSHIMHDLRELLLRNWDCHSLVHFYIGGNTKYHQVSQCDFCGSNLLCLSQT